MTAFGAKTECHALRATHCHYPITLEPSFILHKKFRGFLKMHLNRPKILHCPAFNCNIPQIFKKIPGKPKFQCFFPTAHKSLISSLEKFPKPNSFDCLTSPINVFVLYKKELRSPKSKTRKLDPFFMSCRFFHE